MGREMTPRDLLQAAKLDEAIDALSSELRDNPADVRRRTFLFELLCFAGKYDRAEKQLAVVGQGTKEAEMGALLYHSALHAERMRQAMFESKAFPLTTPPKPVSGTLNGTPFESLTDADPRVGARLELFAAGQYTWIPFEHIESIQMLPPKRLRDMLWAPAIVRTAESFQGMELGEVMIPAIAPLTWRHADGALRLGRVTQWESLDDESEAPIGQKLLLVDDEEFPILELRELTIVSAPATVAD
jgi:type VI secretion system protein ImpE